MVLDDRLPLVDTDIIKLAQLLLNHPKVILSVSMQYTAIIVCDNMSIIQILAVILLEFRSCLFIGNLLAGPFDDIVGFLKVISCISSHLWVNTAAFIMTTIVVELLICGEATLL